MTHRKESAQGRSFCLRRALFSGGKGLAAGGAGRLAKQHRELLPPGQAAGLLQHVAPLVEGEVSGLKLWMGLVMPKRHGSAGSSSTKVPNSLSQIMSTPAKLRSMYLALLAWCTLWWEGC